ncbi:MAG: hypothetical protein CMA64_07815 [Euryarchaeota archaeon]|nr:hypothetical protein [Euryarchaeota archaeon]
MAYFKTNDFISKVRKDDLARSNRFEVVINSPANFLTDREVSLLVEEAQIPGLQIKWAPTTISTWTEQRAHGIEYFGDTAAFTFFCDDNWDVRTYFEDWMTLIADPLSKEVSFPDEYTGTVEIFALDREDNRVTRWKLYDAFPRLMNILPMGQSAEGIVRVNVTFAFRRWVSRGVDAGEAEKLFGIFSLRKGSVKNAINNKILGNISNWLD